ncbi:unnamed protein product [Medioppia subpectinata]|uniref:Uncharacterized protein n=1 Tax=Medioppia subpectinata TaxID=1979941 RepID=A0A7R9PUX6_9ACAR|nr:unnamed protein product [Medioppia subpectinata]CAG2102227.1 unnamed protein product [Medioppia subpectinata]
MIIFSTNNSGTGVYEQVLYVIEILEATNVMPFSQSQTKIIQFERADGHHLNDKNDPNDIFVMNIDVNFIEGEEKVSDIITEFRSLFLNGNSSTHSRRESFTFKQEIHVKPYSSVSIEGYIKTVKDMTLHFQAVRTFTATVPRRNPNTPLNGLTLFVLISKYEKQHDMIVNNNSIVVKQNGIYKGSFGIKTYTKVIDLADNQPITKDMITIPTTPSITTTPVPQNLTTISTPTPTPGTGSRNGPPIELKTSFSTLEMN